MELPRTNDWVSSVLPSFFSSFSPQQPLGRLLETLVNQKQGRNVTDASITDLFSYSCYSFYFLKHPQFNSQNKQQ